MGHRCPIPRTRTLKTLLLVDSHRTRPLVCARGVLPRLARGPGVDLIVQRDQALILADGLLGRGGQPSGTLLVVDGGQLVADAFVDLGSSVASAVRCHHAIVAVIGQIGSTMCRERVVQYV